MSAALLVCALHIGLAASLSAAQARTRSAGRSAGVRGRIRAGDDDAGSCGPRDTTASRAIAYCGSTGSAADQRGGSTRAGAAAPGRGARPARTTSATARADRARVACGDEGPRRGRRPAASGRQAGRGRAAATEGGRAPTGASLAQTSSRREGKGEPQPPPPKAVASPGAKPARLASAPNSGQDSDGAKEGRASWLSEFVAHVRRFNTYAANGTKENGMVRVSITLDRNGRVLSHRVASSSGSSTLDRAALDMVQRAQPFPRFPASMPQAQILEVITLHVSQ